MSMQPKCPVGRKGRVEGDGPTARQFGGTPIGDGDRGEMQVRWGDFRCHIGLAEQ